MPDQVTSNQVPLIEGQLVPRYRSDFSGGVNLYLGPRQIQDNESPSAVDCDFKGSTGVGSRLGYAQIGSVVNARTIGRGMSEFHKNGVDQAIRFADNGVNTSLAYSTGSTWTDVTSITLTSGLEIDCIQAESKLYICNGTDALLAWDGATLTNPANGKIGLYPTYFDKRIWVVDPTNRDTVSFCIQAGDPGTGLVFPDFVTTGATNQVSKPGTITLLEGAGLRITGTVVFKDSLYLFTGRGKYNSIWKVATTATANAYSVTLITASVGCVSHRSITPVDNDLMFADDFGVFTLGEVGTFASIRTTNKSLRVQKVFDSLTGTTKQKLVGKFFNYKYHLFYSLYGSNNDSVIPYDIRYSAWQDWRNIAADEATLYTDANGTRHLYFLEPTTGIVHELYSGTTNNGVAITSTWYSKSFDESSPDLMKLYLDHTFVFGLLTGTVTITVIFNDSQTQAPVTLTQQSPQGGFGRGAFGQQAFGREKNTITVASVVNVPQRLKAKGQKFAVQYSISTTGSWRLDTITSALIPFGHFKFPSANKLN